jgi:primosomal protein N' (replication factor Y)
MPGPGASSAAAQTLRRDEAARLRVLLPLSIEAPFDYLAPADESARPGDLVIVPLGSRERIGCVWDETDKADTGPPAARLKTVKRRLSAPPIPAPLRRFVGWVARYTLAPEGAVLKMVLSVPEALEPERPVRALALASDAEGRLRSLKATPARRRVLDAIGHGPPRAAAELAREAGVTPGVVAGLEKAGVLEAVEVRPPAPLPEPDATRPGPPLSPDQRACADALAEKVRADSFSVTLLDGVTGSGKTEVYFEAIAAALAHGRQTLVLVPEIALTAQWLERFRSRFGAPPFEWHSDLTKAARRRTWRAVADGSARVVVGARSALFLPFPHLGLVVVDEEHDSSFKQEEGVVYHARDMAVARANMERIPVALVSATPSLETVVNASSGRYARLHLPDRFAGAAMPSVTSIDMRGDPPPRQGWLTPTLRSALAETLSAGEQALLFLNRRGYAPLTLCRACGHRLDCPHCTAWLVEHRRERILRCHHCGYVAPEPDSCPRCGAKDQLAACGPGVERLADEVAALFPNARIGVMTSDTLTGPGAAQQFIRKIEDKAFDVVIGTQIVAKGHHFPLLTLVGVVDADLGLAGGDLRAAERTFQLLSQVAGRAGRAALPGRVFLQTYMPDHPVIRALVAGDRDGFYAAEAAARRAFSMPPFGRLAAIIVSGPDQAQVAAAARALARNAPDADGLEVLGPAPAPLARIAGRHRWRLLVKARKDVAPQAEIRRWLASTRWPASVRVRADIDPYSFL